MLDGVACAVSLAESLIRIGLRTLKRNTYAPPLAKPYAGEFARSRRGEGAVAPGLAGASQSGQNRLSIACS